MEDDPADIWAMLLCVYDSFCSGLYHRMVDQDSDILASLGLGDSEDPHRLLFGAIKLYALGDKYDIPAMRRGACTFFERYLERAMNNEEANNEDKPPLDFATVYRVVCNLTPTNDKGLRVSFAKMCAKLMGRLVTSETSDSPDTMNNKRANWSRLLEEDGEMGFEILKCLVQQKQKLEDILNGMIMK